MSFLTSDSLSRRYRAIGFRPEEYMPIIKLIQTWVACSGSEWTVQRLKDLRQLWLHREADVPYSPETRIALDATGIPKGPFRRFFTLTGSKRKAQAWSGLMIYTGFVSASVTPNQVKKFLDGVRRTQPDTQAINDAISLITRAIQERNWKAAPPPRGESIWEFQPRPSKRRPKGRGMVPEMQAVMREADSFLSWQGYKVADFPHIMRGVFGDQLRLIDTVDLPGREEFYSPVIGHVSVIQEPGLKARFIASPLPVVQQMFRPLYSWMSEVNRTLPGNWQYDQSAGKAWARESLVKSGYSKSVDLSGATDNFPLVLQLAALEQLGVSAEWVSAVKRFSGGLWDTRGLESVFAKHINSDRFPYLQWTVGQPLGLIYSFNLFTLAHWLLCRGIEIECGIGANQFCIVGDDVVWFHPEGGEYYVSIMERMGVPISHSKSITSGKVCEFLSCLILTDRILPSYKWKAPSDDSFLDIARSLGRRSIRMFPPRQRDVLRIVGEIPEPFGCGWNPKGLSFWERSSRIPDVPVVLASPKLILAGSRDARLWYSGSTYHPWETVLPPSHAASDQDAVKVLTKAYGNIASAVFLHRSLVESLYALSEVISDDYDRWGRLSAEVIKLMPSALRDLLGIEVNPPSVQVGILIGFLSELRQTFRFSTEAFGRESTLEIYESKLLKLGFRLRSLEIVKSKGRSTRK